VPERRHELALSAALERLGREVHVSDWLPITQAQVAGFAETTLDPDWMHVDPERCRRESPYGGPLVQGFLMTSLIVHFTHQAGLRLEGASHALNYGLDRVRYLLPVLSGARVRDRIRLLDLRERAPGRWLMKTRHTLEVEGEARPAMVADSLLLWIFDEGAEGKTPRGKDDH